MIHIESEKMGDKIVTKCRIEGSSFSIYNELEALFKSLLADDKLTKVLLNVLDDVQEDMTNKGGQK